MKARLSGGPGAIFKRLLEQLSLTLLLCYLVSFGARLHWIPDLLSHFTWQYALGGILILICLLLARSWKYAALIALLTVCNIGELYRHADFSRAPAAAPTMTVVHYNRNIGPTDQTALKQWLTDNADNFDVVVLQEAGPSLQKMANELGTLYPFQIQEARDHAFGTVILSRHEFMEMEKIIPAGQTHVNLAFRIVVQPPEFKQPVAIFALHALPPMGGIYWRQRNAELAHVSRQAGYDTTPHRIMLGDWNVTPYSPFFADALKDSRLTWKIGAPMPVPTWPTISLPWLMQIKIDHILSDDSLALADITRVSPVMSDHYGLVARFAEK